MFTLSKRRPHPPGYLAETDQINENKKKYQGTVHKFKAAQWTHPNGHPRCLMCGQEQSFSPECNREATQEEHDAVVASWGFGKDNDPMSVAKALPLWDGDGVQGAGQPRDRMGRWIRLPGTTAIKSILAKQLDDGTYGVFKDRETTPFKVFKTKKAANNLANKLIKEDANAYWRDKILPKERRERVRQEKLKAEQEKSILADAASGLNLKPVRAGAGRRPSRAPTKYSLDPVARLELPGRPTLAQRNDANAWARREMPKQEAKYAELITRLAGKGISQDPAKRGELSKKYGVPAKRLIEIEQQVYDQMFPQKAAGAPKSRNLGGGVQSTEQQIRAMRTHGARRGYPLWNDNPSKASRAFKATKGPHKGKWLEVSWNGSVEEVDAADIQQRIAEGRVKWVSQLASDAKRAKELADKRKAAQRDIDEIKLERRALRDRKREVARKWAEEQGFDPNDSFWWAMFWNDMSLLLSEQQQEDIETIDITHKVPLARVQERLHVNPKIMAHILDLPDISSREMRGHRPGPKKAQPGEEDFTEASAESRMGSPEWEERNKERALMHDRRMKAAWERYQKRHPNSKKTFSEFKNDYWNAQMRIPGGSKSGLSKLWETIIKKDPLWEGDKYQPPGQPRNRKGEFSRTRAGAIASRTVGSIKGVFDHSGKTLAPGVKVTRPQKGATHAVTGPDNKVLARRKHSPESALYLRNNGATKITDKRLREIYEDRSKVTSSEFDLLMTASAQAHIDGEQEIPFRAVRAGGAQRKLPRYTLIKNLRTQLAQDRVKAKGGAKKGAGGQVLLNAGRRAEVQREKDNAKRLNNERNKISLTVLQKMLDDFGDGHSAVCIHCGSAKNKVTMQNISPERMKPGPLGGKYEQGNLAPAHITCNVKVGTNAQHHPQKYYDEMMKKFKLRYRRQINAGKLKFVYSKNRGKLGKAPS